MAADLSSVLAAIASFYDFAGKKVIHVGAGGGQLIAAVADAGAIVAVDNDPEAVARLREAVAHRSWRVTPRVVQADFGTLEAHADVVFFEFCLHEMDEPARMLAHARALAPEVVIIDHTPDSPWAWQATESEKAARSWGAAERAGITRTATHTTPQRFANHAELLAKVAVMGSEAVARAEPFASRENFTIEMRYRLALISD